MKGKVKVKLLSCVRPSATPWTAAYQAPLSMGFSRQDYWSGVPWPSPKHVSQISIRHHTWAWSQGLVYSGIVCVLCKGLGQMGLEREGICLPGPCILEVAVPTRGFTARCHLGWGCSVLWPVSAWGVGWEVLFVTCLPTEGRLLKFTLRRPRWHAVTQHTVNNAGSLLLLWSKQNRSYGLCPPCPLPAFCLWQALDKEHV